MKTVELPKSYRHIRSEKECFDKKLNELGIGGHFVFERGDYPSLYYDMQRVYRSNRKQFATRRISVKKFKCYRIN